MEALGLILLLVVVATPIAAGVALLRAAAAHRRLDEWKRQESGNRKAIADLENLLRRLERRLDRMETGSEAPADIAEAPSPRPAPGKADPTPQAAEEFPETAAPDSPAAERSPGADPAVPPAPASGATSPRRPPPPPPVVSRPSPPPGIPATIPSFAAVGPSRIPPEDPDSLADRLREWQLLPPTGLSLETGLAAWWATRLGILLAVVGISFFGVYVTRSTPTWVRWFELLLVAIGITVAGDRLRRSVDTFGRVVSGGGLALLYFTAYAGYALPAVKITDDPWKGLLLQFGTIAAIGVVCLRRDRPLVAALAVALGHVSCAFSIAHAIPGPVTPAVLFLSAFSVALYLFRGWPGPLVVALPLAYATFGVHAILAGHTLAYPLALTYLGVTQLLFTGADLEAVRRRCALDDRTRRFLQVFNSSSAIAAAWLFTEFHFPAMRGTTFFGFAILNAAIAVAYHLRQGERMLFQTAGLKATTLLSLGFIALFSGPVVWLILAGQAAVLGRLDRELRSRWIELAGLATWLVSAGFLLTDLPRNAVFDPQSGMIGAATALAWALISAVIIRGWWGQERTSAPREGARTVLACLLVGIAGTLLLLAARAVAADPLEAGHALLAGGVLFALGWAVGHWIPFAIGAIPAVFAFPLFWVHARLWNPSGAGADAIWGGVLLLAAVAAAERFRWRAVRRAVHRELGQVLTGCLGIVHLAISAPLFIATLSAASPWAEQVVLLALSTALLDRLRHWQSDGVEWRAAPRHWAGPIHALVLTGAALLRFSDHEVIWALTLCGGGFLLLDRLRANPSGHIAAVVMAAAAAIHYTVTVAPGIPGDGLIAAQSAVVAALILGITVHTRMRLPEKLRGDRLTGELSLVAIAMVLHQAAFHALSPPAYFIAQAATPFLFVIIGQRCALPAFARFAALPWVPAILIALPGAVEPVGPLLPLPPFGIALAAALAVAFPLAAARTLSTKCGESSPAEPGVLDDSLLASAITLFVLVVGSRAFSHIEDGPLFAVCALGLTVTGSSLRRHGGLWGATIISGAAVAAIFLLPKPGPGLFLANAFGASLVVMATGLLVRYRHDTHRREPPLPLLIGFHAGAGLLGFCGAAAHPAGAITQHATLLWGLAGALVFGLGLLARSREYRFAGLITLGVCIPRVFLVDIAEPLHRIFAFIILGAVLLGIGYTYTRFQDRITSWDDEDRSDDRP